VVAFTAQARQARIRSGILFNRHIIGSPGIAVALTMNALCLVDVKDEPPNAAVC
jgi:hypothetical protein